jgi:ribosomal protein L16 Arg81 hydroxylase
VLSRLVSVSQSRFAADYWGRRALLSKARNLPQAFDDLLGPGAVDELVSERGLRTPFLRVAKAGTTLGDKAFTSGGGVGAGVADQVSDDKLVSLFADGSTLVLQALHRVWPPLIALCQDLAAELGHPVQANAYVTPPQNQGFSNHYDVHDVFVLQTEGEKQWTIHAPVLPSPLRDQPWTERRAAVEARAKAEPLIETTLKPGDCLYLPRGFLHAAQALGGVSTHVTIGVHVWTRHALAEQLIQQALKTVALDPEIRRSLDLGTSFADGSAIQTDVELVRTALIAALERSDPETVASAIQQQARGSQRAAPIGPLKQLHDADTLRDETPIRLRGHLAATLQHVKGPRIVLRSRAGDFPVSEAEAASVKMLMSDVVIPAKDLGFDLVRRMMLAGVAVID